MMSLIPSGTNHGVHESSPQEVGEEACAYASYSWLYKSLPLPVYALLFSPEKDAGPPASDIGL